MRRWGVLAVTFAALLAACGGGGSFANAETTSGFFVGDSFVGTGPPVGGYIPSAKADLGWEAIRGWYSGAGYVATGVGGHGVGFYVPDILAENPDYIVVSVGLNDAVQGKSTASVSAAADAMFDDLAGETVFVVVFSSSGGGDASVSVVQPIADVIETQAVAHGFPFIDTLSEPWISGTGNTSDLQGDGNADIYVGPDALHLTVAGYTYLGERLAAAIQALL